MRSQRGLSGENDLNARPGSGENGLDGSQKRGIRRREQES